MIDRGHSLLQGRVSREDHLDTVELKIADDEGKRERLGRDSTVLMRGAQS